MGLFPSHGAVFSVQFALTSSHLRLVGIVVVAVLVVFVGVRQVMHARNLKRRKAASVGYHDRDVAQYGVGPAGLAGAASARTADGTPLAPTFGPGTAGAPALPPPFVAAGPAASATPSAGRPGAVAAGWLPDPSGDPSVLRYWDGTGWTSHTARRSA